MRLTDHVTLNFNNLSTAAVFLDIEKAFDTTWNPGLLYTLNKLSFPARTVKLISSFIFNRKCYVSVKGELSTPREIQARVSQGSVLFPMLYNLYMNDAPQTASIQLALFAYDTYIYIYERKSLSNRNFILKCMEKYAERKIVFWDTKWFLRNMPYRDHDNRAV
jgi:hypothetical protein